MISQTSPQWGPINPWRLLPSSVAEEYLLHPYRSNARHGDASHSWRRHLGDHGWLFGLLKDMGVFCGGNWAKLYLDFQMLIDDEWWGSYKYSKIIHRFSSFVNAYTCLYKCLSGGQWSAIKIVLWPKRTRTSRVHIVTDCSPPPAWVLVLLHIAIACGRPHETSTNSTIA